MTFITISIAVGLLCAFVYYLIARAYINRLERARARMRIRTRLDTVLTRRADPEMTPRKLTDEEMQRLTAWRVSKGIRERANAPYEKQRGA